MRALVHTHCIIPNYGANLQAVATSLILKRLGVEPVYADLRSKSYTQLFERSVTLSQRTLHEKFVLANVQVTEPLPNADKYFEFLRNNNFDVFVTGSDAVFKLDLQRAPYEPESAYPNPFWLHGVSGKKIAIAPSAMGANLKSNIEKNCIKSMRANLNSFNYISCRDKWTYRQLQSLGCQPDLISDPVTYLPLLDQRYCRQVCDRTYVVVSIPNFFSRSWIAKLTHNFISMGIDVIDIGTPERPTISLDPLEWYKLIAGSIGYIGSRFHPLVIAASHGVPVYSLDQYARSVLSRRRSKSYLLLKGLNLHEYHSTKLEYRFLRPEKVVKSIVRQKENMQQRHNQIMKENEQSLNMLFAKIAQRIT